MTKPRSSKSIYSCNGVQLKGKSKEAKSRSALVRRLTLELMAPFCEVPNSSFSLQGDLSNSQDGDSNVSRSAENAIRMTRRSKRLSSAPTVDEQQSVCECKPKPKPKRRLKKESINTDTDQNNRSSVLITQSTQEVESTLDTSVKAGTRTSKRRRSSSQSRKMHTLVLKRSFQTSHSMACSKFDSSKFISGIASYDLNARGKPLMVPEYATDIFQRLHHHEVCFFDAFAVLYLLL